MNDEAPQAEPSAPGPAGGRRRSARSPDGSASAPPSSGARTSSSTPTPSAASSGWPGVGPEDVVVEVGPGLGLAHPGAAAGRRPRRRASRSTRCSPPRCPRTVAGTRPALTPTGSRWSLADALRLRDAARAAADRAGGQPAVQRLRPRRAAPCSSAFPACARVLVMVQAEVAERLAAGARLAHLRRARASRPPGTPRCAGPGTVGRGRVLAGAQRRLRPGRADPPRAAADARPAGRRCSPASTPRSPSGARRCAPPWPAGPASPAAAEAALRAAGIDPRTRGEQLDVARASPRSPPLAAATRLA